MSGSGSRTTSPRPGAIALLDRPLDSRHPGADAWTRPQPSGRGEPSAAGVLGVEAQWLAVAVDSPWRAVAAGELAPVLEGVTLPCGSRAGVGRHGIVTLSAGRPAARDDAAGRVGRDLAVVREHLAAHGVALDGLGWDPRRGTTAGAAVTVTVGMCSDLPCADERRRLVAGVGVVLAAACANSPLVDDRPTGFRSSRLARVGTAGMVVERRPGTAALRVDALPGPFWRVPVHVAAAVLGDATAADRAAQVTAPVIDRWAEAARHGLAHPVLAHAARRLFDVSLDALARSGAAREVTNVVQAYVERFVARDRTPADDALDAWSAGIDPLLVASTRIATPSVRRAERVVV
jgi:hypothetical protein